MLTDSTRIPNIDFQFSMLLNNDTKDMDATGKAIKDDNYLFLHCDVSKDDDVTKAIETAVNTFGKIDLLVNNASLRPTPTTIDDLTVADFQQTLNVNLVGYFRMCKFSLPHLRRTKGSIVNIASFVNTNGAFGCPHYVASKGGIVSMTRALAVDEASISDVRINSLSPGTVNTTLLHTFCDETLAAKLRKTSQRLANKKLRKNPHVIVCILEYSQVWIETTDVPQLMGRLAEPREIALGCLYLAVDATYCTGSNLKCTGGVEFGVGTKLELERAK